MSESSPTEGATGGYVPLVSAILAVLVGTGVLYGLSRRQDEEAAVAVDAAGTPPQQDVTRGKAGTKPNKKSRKKVRVPGPAVPAEQASPEDAAAMPRLEATEAAPRAAPRPAAEAARPDTPPTPAQGDDDGFKAVKHGKTQSTRLTQEELEQKAIADAINQLETEMKKEVGSNHNSDIKYGSTVNIKRRIFEKVRDIIESRKNTEYSRGRYWYYSRKNAFNFNISIHNSSNPDGNCKTLAILHVMPSD